MKEIGFILIFLGCAIFYFAFDMDISVRVSDYTTGNNYGTDRVSNLSKMNEQQNLIVGSSALCIMGTILLVGGVFERKLTSAFVPNISENTENKKSTPDNSDDRNLTPIQLELRGRYERSEISLEEYKKEWNKLS